MAVVAVDIGGTKTAAALVTRDGRVLSSATAPTPGREGRAAIVATVVRLARGLIDGMPDAAVAGVGIGTAGEVDTRTGTIVASTETLAGWTGTPLADLVRDGLADLLPADAVVDVQNDVDAHAAGEFRLGAAAGARSALIVAVGTGVGAGIIVEGRPLRGAHHTAGALAHLPVPGAEHLRCPCGRPGHLEAIGSGVGMHRHYLSLGGDVAVRDARAVVARARDGDARAQRALVESAAAIGRALAGAVALLDPETVVVTGGVADIGDAWWEPMRRAYVAAAIDALQHVPIVPGLLGGNAPLLGAAACAWERRGDHA